MAVVRYTNGAVYTGTLLNGKRHGEGTYTNPNGDNFTGTWLEGLRQTGEGTLTYSDTGATYTGAWLNGERHGEGTYTKPNGDNFTGTWLDGLRQTGEGTATYSNGDTFTGTWLDGSWQTGEGTLTYSNGATYTGAFLNGERTGEGTYTKPNGDNFTGTWLDGLRQTGEGTYTWDNGDTYTGAWLNGERTGEGTYTWDNGDTFTGIWLNGSPSGSLSPGNFPYFIGTATVEKLKSGDSNIDALLYDDPRVWASNETYDNGSSTTITYSFVENSNFFVDDYEGPNPFEDSVYAFSDSQQAAVKLALAQFSNIANITFVEVAETVSEVGTIRFGFTDYDYGHDHDIEDVWGWATSPGTTAKSGDIWVDSSNKDETFVRGKDSNFTSIMHEIGHVLGLAHPFDGTHRLPTALDFRNYTLMSYQKKEAEAFFNGDYLISSTPMVYDIAAIQYLYGAAEYNEDNTSYKYNRNQPFVEAIWDSGGYDTLDLTGFTKACNISLIPGSYSTIACSNWTMKDNLGIAQGAFLEKVIAGNGNDTITGNSKDNHLIGNSGRDIINGGDGNDTIEGGSGNDVLTGGLGADQFIFYTGDNQDTIKDFNVSEDEVQFYNSRGQALTDAQISLRQNSNGEAVYSSNDGTSVTLEGVSLSSIRDANRTSVQKKLEELQAKYEALLSQYNESLARLAELEAKLETFSASDSPAKAIGSLADQSVTAGSSVNLSEVLSSKAADGSSFSWINVYDATGGNNFVKNGVEIDASAGAWVSASDLANITIKGDSQASEQTLYFQTYEGGTYSDWDSIILTTTGSVTAVAQPIGSLADQTVAAGSSLNLSEILSSTNADGGSYSRFAIYDATGGNNFVYYTGLEINASAGAWLSASDLANITIKGDSKASEQTLYFQTYDGTNYSAWDSIILTTTVEI